MYEISLKRRFAAAHSLADYDGPCSKVHGHTWTVEVGVTGECLDSMGMLIDFRLLREMIDRAISDLDHSYLNDLPVFSQPERTINPTAENIAFYIHAHVKESLLNVVPSCKIISVRVWESPDASACYREDV